MGSTIEYYNQNAQSFADGTAAVNFTEIQNVFLELIPEGGYILDFGCGSGRDTKDFLDQGYRVEATDGSEILCKLASKYTGISVKHMFFEELEEIEKYDGIWACASILHAKKKELPDIIHKMSRAVKTGGIIYTSFKYEEFEGERNGRYFTDFTTDTFKDFIHDMHGLKIEEHWITGDVRPGRGEEKWLNLIMQKK